MNQDLDILDPAIITKHLNSESELSEIQEYIDIFAELVADNFIYSKCKIIRGLVSSSVYHHTYEFNRYPSCLLYGIKRSNRDLLLNWFEFRPSIYNTKETMVYIYKNVKTEELPVYIDMIDLLGYYGVRVSNQFSIKLLLLFLELKNITLDEFAKEYTKYVYSNIAFIDESLSKFREIMTKMNNNKISKLWWPWKDFSGNYSNYIEWLPRETLDDTIMVQHFGEYQPDYTTYVR